MGFDFATFWDQNQKIILAAVFFFVGLGLIFGISKLLSKAAGKANKHSALVRYGCKIFTIILIVVDFCAALALAGAQEQLNRLLVTTGLWEFFPKLLSAALILAVGVGLIKIILSLYDNGKLKQKLDRSIAGFLRSALNIALYIVVFITALSALGVETTSFIAILSAAGLALSLAMQDSLKNLAGAISIILLKPFEVGDYIQTPDIEGTVSAIGLVYTTLNTVDNKRISVPNGLLSADKITNYSSEPQRRLDLTFSIGYEDDFAKACGLIYEIAMKNPLTLHDPAPVIRMSEHAASSINITCRLWVDNQNYWTLKFDMLEQVKQAFDEHHINIPYQQLQLHIQQ